MRRSNRERIIAGALEIIGREGADALTFEALAQRVGLTRGGVVYHFRTREALLAGIAQDLLARWKNAALAALAASVLDGALLPGELALLVSGRAEAADLWDDFRAEWVGDPLALTPAQRVGLLAVDGWWAEPALGTGCAGAMDADTLALIIDLVSGRRP